MYGFRGGVDPPGFLIHLWERFVAWVHRRDVTFFLTAAAAVVVLTVFGM